MGETRIHFKVYGANGEAVDLEAVVDTGATFSKIPESVAARLGLEAEYETEVELGDGTVIGRKLTLAEVEIEEVRRPVLVAIGEEEKPLIGYTTLELLGFKVNPITGKLERAMPIEYREKMKMKIPAAKIYFPEEDRKELLKQIDEILESGQLTLGKYTREFEERFAEYVGTKYAIAVNSGTSALEIPLRALDVKGHSVIVPTNTFFATPASVIHAGGRVIFADVTEDLCIDPESVKEKIGEDTRGVIIVHIGGIVAPRIKAIQEMCEDHNLFLIEDAAHAHGSTLDGKMAGGFGKAAAFSFYPTKVMTSGEGGMITMDEEKMYKRALVFRDQGKAGFYGNVHTEMGYNWRMSEVHAAIGLSQFARLEEFIGDRRKIAKIYDVELTKNDRVTPIMIPPNVESNYYKYVALLDGGIDRAIIKKELKEKHDVGLSGEVYELPCHLQPIFKEMYSFKEGDFPVAEDICKRQICLPVFATMTEEQARYVVDSLKGVLK